MTAQGAALSTFTLLKTTAINKLGTVHVVPGTTVVVNPPSDSTLDALTLGLLVGSLLPVVVTGVLAWKTAQLHIATKNLAKDTVEGNKLADKHHQESLTPFLVLTEFDIAQDGVSQSFVFRAQNQGNGPAVNVKATIYVADTFPPEINAPDYGRMVENIPPVPPRDVAQRQTNMRFGSLPTASLRGNLSTQRL